MFSIHIIQGKKSRVKIVNKIRLKPYELMVFLWSHQGEEIREKGALGIYKIRALIWAPKT